MPATGSGDRGEIMKTRAEPTKHRAVVAWAGQGQPIMLTVYDPDSAVVSVSLSPVRALELAKQLMERAVASIKTKQWGKPWPG